jgi:peptide/nickel transport system substrate-binding protein
MRPIRLTLAAILVTVLALSLAACAPTPAGPTVPTRPLTGSPVPPTQGPLPPPLSTLVMVTDLDDVATLDPHHAYEITNLMIHNATYDTLVAFEATDLTTAAPRLADSWDRSPDGLTYTFHLRPGITFASGNPLTAEDVRFSWKRLQNIKDNPSLYADIIADIEVVDQATVRVTLAQPSPAFVSICAAPAMSIVDHKVVREHGGTDAPDAEQTDNAKDWLDQNSAGSGPFILVRWTPKAEIVLEANPNYWHGKPQLQRIIIKHVPDSVTALQMIQRGEADLLDDLDLGLAKPAQTDPNLNVFLGQSLNQTYLAMTYSAELSKPLSDKRVRQAVSLSVDYDGLIKTALHGYGSRAPSIIPIGVLGVDPAMIQGQDVGKARDLLKEAGYEDGFEVGLSYASNRVRDAIAAKLKSDLAEVGITVTLQPLEMSAYLSEMRAQKLAFCLGEWTPDYLDPTMWTNYFTYHDRGIAYRMLYNNPEAEKYADIVGTESDPVKREQAIKDLQRILMDDMPFTMLYQSQQIVATAKGVTGFVYHPAHFVSFFNLSKW